VEVIRAALQTPRAQQSGQIVNISAAAVIANYASFSIYCATKPALVSVSESLAAELKPLGIKVTIVQPGPFRTDFIGRSLDRARSIADYDRASGKFLRFLKTMDGKQPLRLVLGKYANDKVRRKLTTTETELIAHRPFG